MIRFINLEADNVLGILINGKISEKEFEEVTESLNEKIDKHSEVRIYAEIESFGGTTLETFFEDLKYGIKNWDHLEKEAVVTQKKWIEKIVDLSNKISPGIEVKAFTLKEKEEAKNWIQS